MKHMNIILNRSCLSLALCLVLFVSLFAVPAFAAGDTIVIIGDAITSNSSESSGAVVSSSGTAAGSGNLAGSGIAADAPTSTARVIIGSQADHTTLATSGAVVVQSDGTIVPVVRSQQADPSDVEEAAAPAAPVITPAAPTGLAAELLAKVNQVRSENGLSALKYSNDLQSIANLRAQESTISFGHTRPDGSHCSTAVTVDWNVTGENLIQVTSSYAIADLMMETWMNSPTHRYNILHPSFTDIAVGIWETNDTTFVSLVFIG